MATPIGYTPQFVKTDLGLIGQQLAQRDAEYQQALQQQQALEDAYASYQVDPRDIALKNEVLNKYQDEAKKIIDRYGGDYAAASKDLSRLATRSKQDPFFTLAGERRRLAEEERKKLSELGPLAIQTKSVRDMDLIDPNTGQYITPDQLSYNVYDKRLIGQDIADKYGKLAGRITSKDTILKEGRFPGYNTIRTATTRGLTEDEAGKTALEMADYIKQYYPGITDEQAMGMAGQYANQLVMGTTYSDKDIQDLVATGKFGGTGAQPLELNKHILETDPSKAKSIAKDYARQTSGNRSVLDASSKGWIGTSDFLTKTDNPITNMYVKKAFEDNPELQSLSNRPIKDYSKVFVSGIGNVDVEKKYGFSNDQMNKAIQSAEASRTAKLFSTTPIAGINVPGLSAGSFQDELRDVLVNDYNMPKSTADGIIREYSNNTKEFNSKYNEALKKSINVNDMNKLLSMSTISATDKGGKELLDRIMGLSQRYLTSGNLEFVTGDLVGEMPKDVLKHYGNKVPEIIGIGGDSDVGVHVAVRDKDGNEQIAKLNLSPDAIADIAMAFNRKDLAISAFDEQYKKQTPDGAPIGENAIYRKSPSGRGLVQLNNGSFITNEQIDQINKQLKTNFKITGKDSDPYEFDSFTAMIQLVKEMGL